MEILLALHVDDLLAQTKARGTDIQNGLLDPGVAARASPGRGAMADGDQVQSDQRGRDVVQTLHVRAVDRVADPEEDPAVCIAIDLVVCIAFIVDLDAAI